VEILAPDTSDRLIANEYPSLIAGENYPPTGRRRIVDISNDNLPFRTVDPARFLREQKWNFGYRLIIY
jgi:hypothetical protein